MFFDIFEEEDEKIFYFLEGKRKLKSRTYFNKVISETIPFLDIADYVYFWTLTDEDFEGKNKSYIEFYKSRDGNIPYKLKRKNRKVFRSWEE